MVSIFLYIHPYLGKIPILTHVFEMGWNHTLGIWLAHICPNMSSCLDSYGFGNQWRFQVPMERRASGMVEWLVGGLFTIPQILDGCRVTLPACFCCSLDRRGWGCWVWGVGIITYIRCTFAVGFAARSVVCGLVGVTYGVQTINLVAFGHFDDAVFVS